MAKIYMFATTQKTIIEISPGYFIETLNILHKVPKQPFKTCTSVKDLCYFHDPGSNPYRSGHFTNSSVYKIKFASSFSFSTTKP